MALLAIDEEKSAEDRGSDVVSRANKPREHVRCSLLLGIQSACTAGGAAFYLGQSKEAVASVARTAGFTVFISVIAANIFAAWNEDDEEEEKKMKPMVVLVLTGVGTMVASHIYEKSHSLVATIGFTVLGTVMSIESYFFLRKCDRIQ